tara:strand:- start:103 stop:1137 length:1035 start_codon:yes stop_codon:yes gene_type:complete
MSNYHQSDVVRVDFQRQAIEHATGDSKERQVFVGGVSMYASEDDLMHVFETAGTVVAVRWGVDRQTQKFKGFCHIEFASADAVPLAVSKTGTDVCGRNIRVSAARGPSNGKGGNAGKKQDNFIVDKTGSKASNSDSRSKGEKKEVCLRCRQEGHKMSDCPMMRGGGPASQGRKVAVSCYNCGGNSHRASHCRKEKIGNGFSFATCFICGTKGHLASQCDINKQGMYPNGGGCRVCGNNQHLVKDCPEKKSKKKRKREAEAAAAGGDGNAGQESQGNAGGEDDTTSLFDKKSSGNGSGGGDSLSGNFAVENISGDVDAIGEGEKVKKKKKKKKKSKKAKHATFDD